MTAHAAMVTTGKDRAYRRTRRACRRNPLGDLMLSSAPDIDPPASTPGCVLVPRRQAPRDADDTLAERVHRALETIKPAGPRDNCVLEGRSPMMRSEEHTSELQ